MSKGSGSKQQQSLSALSPLYRLGLALSSLDEGDKKAVKLMQMAEVQF